jgi:hypothetical protein
MKSLSQNSRPGPDSNRTPPENESEELLFAERVARSRVILKWISENSVMLLARFNWLTIGPMSCFIIAAYILIS